MMKRQLFFSVPSVIVLLIGHFVYYGMSNRKNYNTCFTQYDLLYSFVANISTMEILKSPYFCVVSPLNCLPSLL